MAYQFELIGISPVLTFFYQQQRFEKTPVRSKAFLGSYECTLDAFIDSTKLIHQKPQWNWDEVTSIMVDFWLTQGDNIREWRTQLAKAGTDSLLVGHVINTKVLRNEFETLFEL